MDGPEVSRKELPVHSPAQDAAWTAALTDTMITEWHLLDELIRVLKNQQIGVANNDISALDESVYAAQRIFLTLRQARRHRRGLLNALMGQKEVALGELDLALGSGMTASLTKARDGLQAAAQRLARQMEVNRRVIQEVIASGDRLIRAVCGVPEQTSLSLYTPEAEGAEPSSRAGVLFNKQI